MKALRKMQMCMYGMQVYNVHQKACIPTSYALLGNLIECPFFNSQDKIFLFVSS